MRLGEFFIQKNVITPAQLEEALKAQLIFGGHLGTCLMEMGYIDENTLGETLAELFHVGYAPPALFENVSRSVVELLPKRLVEKHHAVPFERTNRQLHVAMIDPKNLPALDEISFATGQTLQAWVSPEARIYQVMERYYDISRRQRYISVCQGMDRAAKDGGPSGGGNHSGGRSGLASAYDPPPYMTALAQSAQPEIPVVADPHQETGAAVGVPRKGPHLACDRPQEELTEAFCRAESVGDLSWSALEYAAIGLQRCALFIVRGTTATLWSGRGFDWAGEREKAITLAVPSDPLFELLLERDCYRGPLPADPRYRLIHTSFGVEPPAELLLVPGYLDDRLVVLMYGDGGPDGTIRGDTGEYHNLVRKLACALHLVALKKKLRALDAPDEAAAAEAAAKSQAA